MTRHDREFVQGSLSANRVNPLEIRREAGDRLRETSACSLARRLDVGYNTLGKLSSPWIECPDLRQAHDGGYLNGRDVGR